MSHGKDAVASSGFCGVQFALKKPDVQWCFKNLVLTVN